MYFPKRRDIKDREERFAASKNPKTKKHLWALISTSPFVYFPIRVQSKRWALNFPEV
jgi:hypothetical protein